MDVLHLHFDVLQAAGAIQQRLRMLGQLGVRQVALVTQRMLQARPVVHRDRAELDLHRHVMLAGGEEHRGGVDHMQRTVSVLLGALDVILDAQHLDVGLRRQVVRYRIHIVTVVADHSNTGDIEEIVAYGFDGDRQVAPFQLADDRFDGFQPAFHVVDRIVAEPYLELVVENLQLGAYLIHRSLIQLHEVDEFGDVVDAELSSGRVEHLQLRADIGCFESAVSIKYHVSQYSRPDHANL